MKIYRLTRAAMMPIVGGFISTVLLLGITTLARAQSGAESGVQVLTRGPVHEAFAAASMSGGMAGEVIARAPYAPITELPPDQRPLGDDVAWIPGYWGWDEDRTDFIWVSGVWRDLPPGRQWVPGYWASAQGGSQWISGFWGEAIQTEVTYLPPPPEPLEVGPSAPAPYPGNLWAPGCWIWQQSRYNWQPGYWVPQQPNWVWSPAHYTWTPRGHVYVPGYWDHDLDHRGVIFAPVYYEQPVYTRPNYYYSPAIVIDLALIAAFLFVQPRSHHYYYGDYYDSRYESHGYYPWHSPHVSHYGHDSLYLQYRATQLREHQDWDNYVDQQFHYRREHIESRPPQTLALQINLINSRESGARENLVIGRSLTEVVQSTGTQRFSPVNPEDRKQIEARGRSVRNLQTERARIEAPTKGADVSGRSRESAEPARVRMPVSPVASRPGEKVERTMTPPPAPDVPRPRAEDPKVPGREQVKDTVKPPMATPRPATQRTAPPRLPGPPESRAARPATTREKPHPAAKRLDIPVNQSIPRTPSPVPGSPGEKVSAKVRETSLRPPQAVETPRSKRADVPQELRPAEPVKVRNETGSEETAGNTRKPTATKEMSRERQPVNKVQRPGAGARAKAKLPPVEESPKPGKRSEK